jgi:hypothetical protein
MNTPLRLLATNLILTACAAEVDQPDDPNPADTDPVAEMPTEYTYAGDEDAQLAFDPDAIEEAIDDTLTHILSLQAAPVRAAYDASVAHMEPGCPDWYDYEGNAFWYAYCTTDTGTSFNGYGFYTVYEDADAFGDGNSWDLVSISGAATVRDSAGHTFHLGGVVYDGTGTNADGASLWVSQVAGGFMWDAPEAAGTWLETPNSPSMLLYAIQYPLDGDPGNYMYINGSAAGLSDASTAVRFSTVVLADTRLGMACSAEPVGTLSVRDHAGQWWDIRFDLDETGRLTGDCDGCGGVYLGDEYQGEVCADFSSLLDWESNPW